MNRIAFAFAFGLYTAVSAHAAVFVVTRTDDPTPDACTPQDCSLREAVLAANAGANEIHEVHLAAGNYQLNDRVDVDSLLYFVGAGTAQTRVQGSIAELFRTFGGTLHASDMSFDAGGHVVMEVLSSFALFSNVDFPNSDDRIFFSTQSAEIDGGRWTAWLQSDTVRDFRITGTTLQRASMSIGLGSGTQKVLLSAVTIDGSLAPATPSGFSVSISGSGIPPSVDISDSRILHTTLGAEFSALNFDGQLTVARTRYEDNDEPLHVEGGIVAQIQDSSFYNNRAPDASQGHTAALWVSLPTPKVTVERSTFLGNTGNANRGGAVLVEDGAALTIRNSTFSNNSIAQSIAAGGARGGAIGFRGSTDITALTLEHVTAVAPTVLPQGLSGSILGGDGAGSAITLSLRNSLVRGSCSIDSGALDTGIGNIESAGHSCGFSSVTNDNDVATSALALGTLAAHGGYTETFVPAASSAMLDAGSIGSCADEDQRRYFRPYGSGCDVGAVERSDVLFAYAFD